MFRRVWSALLVGFGRKVESKIDPLDKLEVARRAALARKSEIDSISAKMFAQQTEAGFNHKAAGDRLVLAEKTARKAVENKLLSEQGDDEEAILKATYVAQQAASTLARARQEVEDARSISLQAEQSSSLATKNLYAANWELSKVEADIETAKRKLTTIQAKEAQNKLFEQLHNPAPNSAYSVAEIDKELNSRYALAEGTAQVQHTSIQGTTQDLQLEISREGDATVLAELEAEVSKEISAKSSS